MGWDLMASPSGVTLSDVDLEVTFRSARGDVAPQAQTIPILWARETAALRLATPSFR